MMNESINNPSSMCLIDTCIISEILKNKKNERNLFVNFSLTNKVIPCISIFSIFELRKTKNLFEQFIDFFNGYPLYILQAPLILFEEEVHCYPNPLMVEPINNLFSGKEREGEIQLRDYLTRIFSDERILDSEMNWNANWKKEMLEKIINLKPNFPPDCNSYNLQDAKRFLNDGMPDYIMSMQKNIKARLNTEDYPFDLMAFPSIRTIFYTVFYRFYAENRVPELQDIFDIFIYSVVPYVGTVIAENFQAEIFRKLRNNDDIYKNLNILTMKDLLDSGNAMIY